ncbi:putative transcriptional regulator, TetR family [Ruminiclostridium papyrosolvens DSM 2782]|uniref:Transcriptional regulator, TetR family n=1 Tax=Ruminiclostridium papyrosolvens DSM 2782 TaxID=588581 RepID=F1TBG8_9FIRM|nr:TetR/AcrR family transcriptional regulator C-terminal domain-containing protein [Ruminiclostridium papyrosolvens]EGD48372.1 putative transcriptional regulator, TetR family [Ruminiclostridium papyrosolvens DSM 2782]WES34124.1 TetR/AcrR family transcriptional regulator C-terminal domain-containing protein [Ruminiclostridium papyrosolvens DSM 2782]
MKYQHKKTRTRTAIIEAFQYLMTIMPFDKIRIQNITDIAEVNRHSFYNHFNDKYDLLYQIVTQMLVIEFDADAGESLIQQSINQVPRILRYFEENRKFFKNAFKDDKQQSFNNFFQKLIFDWFTIILNKTVGEDEASRDSFYITQTRFYVAGYSQLLMYWLYNEPDKSADVLAEEIIKIFKGAFNTDELISNI